MNYEYEIQNLKATVANLQQTVIQMGRNNAPFETKVDSTADNLISTDGNVDTNTANIDYLAMMTDVEIPTESEDEDALSEV